MIPKELLEARQWLTHVDKTPSLKPNAFENDPDGAWDYDTAVSKLNGPTTGLGFMFGSASPIACIDIDAPKESQLPMEQYAQVPILERDYIQAALAALPIPSLPQLTYTEVSPSGNGLHIWLNIIDKHSAPTQAYLKSTDPALKGQLSLRKSYMTVTLDQLPGAPSALLSCSVQMFNKVFMERAPRGAEQSAVEQDSRDSPLFVEHQAPQSTVNVGDAKPQSPPPLQRVLDALQLLPSSPSKELEQAYLTLLGRAYEHYTYWLSVGMALHNYGVQTSQSVQCFRAYLSWSQKDIAGFKSDEDVEVHWKSFSSADAIAPITVATLLHLANHLVFAYPRPTYKDGKPTRYPKLNEYVNFEYLLNKYEIKAWNDQSGATYISGDPDIMRRYFQFPAMSPPILDKFYGPYSQNGLITATTQLCQNAHWQGLQNTKNLVSQWVERAALLDIFTEWLDTPFDSLPEAYRLIRTHKGLTDAREYNQNSTVDFLFNCLNVRPQAGSASSEQEEMALYKACFEKTLYHIVKYRDQDIKQSYRNDSGGMLILVGPEHTYKSTFCRMLLPMPLQTLRKEVNSQINNAKAERDFIRYLGSKAIVQLDEFEGMMNMKTHSSFFKNLLSSDNMSQVDIYNTSETFMPRKAIIIATTNEVQHVLSREGSRRLWFIPTGTIATGQMQYFNHHKFYNTLREQLQRNYAKGNLIWQLTKEQSALRSSWNSSYAATTSLSTMLEDVWAFTNSQMPEDYLNSVSNMRSSADRGTKLYRTIDVAGVLRENGFNVNLAQLKHELTRYCSQWTGTQHQQKTHKKRVLIKGKLCQNWYEPRKTYQYEYWVMPPLTKSLSASWGEPSINASRSASETDEDEK